MKDIKPYADIREHFIMRLKERYNIIITNDEYDEIVKNNDYIRIYNLSFRRKLVWAKIKNENVLCIHNKKIKDIRESSLLTCLPFSQENRLPVPKIFGINDFDSINFEESVNIILKEVFTLLNDYYSMGTKNFFINHPTNINYKAIIHFWNKNGEIDLDRVIDYVVKKFIADGTFKVIKLTF